MVLVQVCHMARGSVFTRVDYLTHIPFFFEPSISPILLTSQNLSWPCTSPSCFIGHHLAVFPTKSIRHFFLCKMGNDISSVKTKSNDRCQLADHGKHIRLSLIFFSFKYLTGAWREYIPSSFPFLYVLNRTGVSILEQLSIHYYIIYM
jgi:hypothetical protein